MGTAYFCEDVGMCRAWVVKERGPSPPPRWEKSERGRGWGMEGGGGREGERARSRILMQKSQFLPSGVWVSGRLKGTALLASEEQRAFVLTLMTHCMDCDGIFRAFGTPTGVAGPLELVPVMVLPPHVPLDRSRVVRMQSLLQKGAGAGLHRVPPPEMSHGRALCSWRKDLSKLRQALVLHVRSIFNVTNASVRMQNRRFPERAGHIIPARLTSR